MEFNMTVADGKQTGGGFHRFPFPISSQPPHLGPDSLQPSAPYASHSLHRLPECTPIHLSHPVPLALTLAFSPGQPRSPAPPPRPAPPHHDPAPPRGPSFRRTTRHISCRMVMVSGPCLTPSFTGMETFS